MLVNVVISLNYSRLIANAKTLMYISSTKQNCKNNNFQNRFAKPGLPLFRQTVLTQMYATNTDGQKKQKKLENAFYADYPVLIYFYFFYTSLLGEKTHIQAILQQDDKRSILESHPSMLMPAADFTLQTLLHAT